MKKLVLSIVLAIACTALVAPVFTGCGTPPSRLAYNSLATTGTTVSTAYQAYLQEVLQGLVPTNDVPKITAQYRQFKVLFDAACVTASFSTNFTSTPPEVVTAGAAVTMSINSVKPH